MKAVTQDRYGIEHVMLSDVPIPEPREGQVRVRVAAASINPLDWHMAVGQPYMMRLTEGLRRPKPRTRGVDVAGVIDAVGPGVTDFSVGDAVFGIAAGSFAEYAIGEPGRLARIPEGMPECEAAALGVAAVTALQAVEKAEVAGKRVLVNGASGGVGHFAVQIARAEGAAHIIGVCSGRNAAWVADLGADEVIDYEAEDFTDRTVDVVIDCVGNRSGREIANALTDDGRWVVIGTPHKRGPLGPARGLAAALISYRFRSQQCIVFVAEETSERFARIGEHVSEGSLSVRVAGKRPLREFFDAFDRVESQRIPGKLLIIP